MAKNTFFDEQTDLTASKILIYRQYLSSYLPKVLMQYGQCLIADFFCGRGKNGQQDGSPLVLLEVAKKMLENPVLKTKHPNAEIVIVFSDAEKKYCDDLAAHLLKMFLPPGIKVQGPYCTDFKSIKSRFQNEESRWRAKFEASSRNEEGAMLKHCNRSSDAEIAQNWPSRRAAGLLPHSCVAPRLHSFCYARSSRLALSQNPCGQRDTPF